MSMYAVPQMGPEPLPAWSGAEVYVTSYHHVFQDTEHLRGMGLWVNLSGEPSDRLALLPLRNALRFAECKVLGGTDWPQQLADAFVLHQPQWVSVVVYVDVTPDARGVQSFLDTLHALLHEKQILTVVVSGVSDSLASLTGTTGFVRGVHSTDGNTARQVFLALASLMANESIADADMEYLLPVFGPAATPTVLAEALWFTEGEGRLVYPSDADKQAVASARAVVAVTYIPKSPLKQLGHFLEALRSDAALSDSTIYFSPVHALMPGLLPASVGWVPILCRQDAAAAQSL